MGNCQAVDAAALVVQHPSGKIDRMYWPIPASKVMKMNPGHYVSLIIPIPIEGGDQGNSDGKTVRYTRVKLLRPTDTLVLGRAYRLVTSQEVMKVLRAKKHAKMKKESSENLQTETVQMDLGSQSDESRTQVEKGSQGMMRNEKPRHRSGSTNFSASRSKSWRPSLHSISEAGNQ